MVGHGAKFGRKKEEAIVALLTHRSIEEAAKAVGVGTQTLPSRAVNRDDILNGAAQLGVDLDQHISFCIEAMKARG
jgi:hypothetical protein